MTEVVDSTVCVVEVLCYELQEITAWVDTNQGVRWQGG